MSGYYGSPQTVPFGAAGPVVLGDFVFDGFEVPAAVPWGGDQHIVLHKLPGGVRVADVMGRDDADISWSGHFLSSDASQRADRLDQMRIAGAPLELDFAWRSYTVLIKELRLDQRKINHVPYSIICTVIADRDAEQQQTQPNTAASVSSDLNSAQNVPPIADPDPWASASMDDAQTAMAGQSTLSANTAVTRSVSTSTDDAYNALEAQRRAADAQVAVLTAQAGSNGVLGVTDVPSATYALQSAGASTATLAMANTQAAYVGRTRVNLGNLY